MDTTKNIVETLEYLERDERGLIKKIDHKFTQDGLVDWFAMLKPEHLYVIKDKEEAFKKQYGKTLSELEISKVDKKYLCILLNGIRYLAWLRGYKTVRPIVNNVVYSERYEAVASCTVTCNISWIGNYETKMQEVEYGSIAGASLKSVDDFVKKYIETIAENRAFCRAVRGFLNISVVSKDEIGPDTLFNSVVQEDEGKTSISNTPAGLLQKRLDDEKWSFDLFQKAIVKNHKDKFKESLIQPENWTSLKDIPPKDVFMILGVILPPKK